MLFAVVRPCSTRQVAIRSREWDRHHRAASVPYLSSKSYSLCGFSAVNFCSLQAIVQSKSTHRPVVDLLQHTTIPHWMISPIKCCGECIPLTVLVSLQLVKMRLGVPCRVLTCAHLQCFDAVFFLQMNEKKPTWTCPVCDKPAPFELLTIDG